jgi:serine/threonine protein kinase
VRALTTGVEGDYRWGLDRFLLEARTLAKFSHPGIVRVLRYFEAHATAYMVMDYERGESLKAVLAKRATLAEPELKSILATLLDGLAAVHAAGFLHRDIKTDNILIRPGGQPVLIDFGAARNALSGSTRTLTAILTPGFAPPEQYSGDGRQGPRTDLYAMGCVLYGALTGQKPPDAVTRMRADTVDDGLAAARSRYSEPFLRAVRWSLALDESARPQSVEEWRKALAGETAPPPAPAETTVPRKPAELPPTVVLPRTEIVPPPVPPRRSRWMYVAAGAGIVVAALFVVIKIQRAAHDKAETARAAVAEPAQGPMTPELKTKLERLRQEMEADFQSADRNGDGFLSQDEVRGRFPVIAREFAKVDADGDGRISLLEFLQFRKRQFERRLGKAN